MAYFADTSADSFTYLTSSAFVTIPFSGAVVTLFTFASSFDSISYLICSASPLLVATVFAVILAAAVFVLVLASGVTSCPRPFLIVLEILAFSTLIISKSLSLSTLVLCNAFSFSLISSETYLAILCLFSTVRTPLDFG